MSTDPKPRDPFEDRLRTALRAEVHRMAVTLDRERLRATAGAPPSSRRLPGWWPIPAVSLAVGILAAVVLIQNGAGPAGERADLPGAGTPVASPTPTSAVAAGSPIAGGGVAAPITLADCRIEPTDASLAFSGWATTALLDVSGGSAAPGQPVYALITRGLAEWTGWRDTGSGSIFPPPVGRMGCIFDPSSGQVSQVGVALNWQAPAIIDGCPASTEDRYAGYREIGGPRAWALLPTGSSWSLGQRGFHILVRLSPALAAGETLTAWTEPLDASAPRTTAAVQTQGIDVQLAPPGATTAPAAVRYYLLDANLSRPGCWLVDLEVNGRLAGAVVVPVLEAPGVVDGRPRLVAP